MQQLRKLYGRARAWQGPVPETIIVAATFIADFFLQSQSFPIVVVQSTLFMRRGLGSNLY